MKNKLTHSLPQIRCSEETKKSFDEMSNQTKRTITNILQLLTEKVAEEFKKTGKINLL
jgi:predicted DNA-binding protein